MLNPGCASRANSSYDGRSPCEPPGPIHSLSQTPILVTGSPASTAAFSTTGTVRQFRNVQNDPDECRMRSTSRYQAVNHRLLFIMSAHPPDFDARFPADTAPMT